MKDKQRFDGEEEDVADVLCAAQMADLIGEKSNTRMDTHLKDVKVQQTKIFDIIEGLPGTTSRVDPIPENTHTISSSQKLLAQIKRKVEEQEKKSSKTFRRSNLSLRDSFEVKEKHFYAGLTSDQRDAGDFFLHKIRSLGEDD